MEAPTVATALRPRRLRVNLAAAARWGLVVVFAWSAGGKLFWPADFRGLLVSSGFIPRELLAPIAYGLPTAELAIALCLAVRRGIVPGLFGALLLALVFVGVHAYLLWAGTIAPCGCAGLALSFASRRGHTALLAVSAAMTAAVLCLLFAGGARQLTRR